MNRWDHCRESGISSQVTNVHCSSLDHTKQNWTRTWSPKSRVNYCVIPRQQHQISRGLERVISPRKSKVPASWEQRARASRRGSRGTVSSTEPESEEEKRKDDSTS